jgi:hypothetical protein
MTNHAARNIASDYASRHMRKARRKRWNDEDRAICIAKYDALATADEQAEFKRMESEDKLAANSQKTAEAKSVIAPKNTPRNNSGGWRMAKFGRYEFGKDDPVEEYAGDFMELEHGYVRIFRGKRDVFSPDEGARLVAAIHLDKGQSVREMGGDAS